MMQQTTLDSDISTELASSISGAAACESRGAEHRAESAAVCRSGCGLTLLLCEAHLDHLRGHVARRSETGERFGCAQCRTEEVTLDAAFDVTKLR